MLSEESCTAIKWVLTFRPSLQDDDEGDFKLINQELAELAGYTSRVADLLDTMDDVKAGKYQKKLVSSANVEDNAKSKSLCIFA